MRKLLQIQDILGRDGNRKCGCLLDVPCEDFKRKESE